MYQQAIRDILNLIEVGDKEKEKKKSLSNAVQHLSNMDAKIIYKMITARSQQEFKSYQRKYAQSLDKKTMYIKKLISDLHSLYSSMQETVSDYQDRIDTIQLEKDMDQIFDSLPETHKQ